MSINSLEKFSKLLAAAEITYEMGEIQAMVANRKPFASQVDAILANLEPGVKSATSFMNAARATNGTSGPNAEPN